MTNGNIALDDEVVYAFSSSSRNIYTKDIYNTLALPPKFKIRFRYREEWHNISDDDISRLEGKDAIIVASPSKENGIDPELAEDSRDNQTKYSFFPLRKASVESIDTRGSVLYITFELKPELFNYGSGPETGHSRDDPFSLVDRLNEYPQFGDESKPGDIFLTVGEPPISGPSANGQILTEGSEWSDEKCDLAWQQIVQWLGNHPAFSETLFYRIRSLIEAETSVLQEPKRLFGVQSQGTASVNNVGYELRADSQYLLYISLSFAGPVPNNVDRECIKCNADPVKILPDVFDLGFRTEEKYLTIDPQRRTTSYDTLLSLTTNANFNTPQVEFPIRIKPTLRRKYTPQVVFFCGLFLILVGGSIVNCLPIVFDFSDRIPERIVRRLTEVLGAGFMIAGMHYYVRFRQVD